MRLLSLLLLLTVLHFSGISQKTVVDKRLAGIDTAINSFLKDWHAAGCAVAVVQKDKVIFSKGFGYRNYEQHLPVTENTVFAIGSCSKAFTASLLGMLESDGKLDLDKPVHDYLPELKFYNDYLTDHVTIRDMMCHRTGLPRHDYSWYGATTSRDSLLYRIRFLEPSAELRQQWQYNNFMFLAQGILAEKLYGKKWEDLVKEKIMTPLGMTHSNFSINDLTKAPDFTYGYRDLRDSIVRMEYVNIDPIGPAGSINSTAVDMANWVMTWVNGGKFKGKEIIPPSFVNQAMTAQMVIGGGLPGTEYSDVFGTSYGLGWFISSYRGHYMVQHGGNIDGFSANVAFFPSDSIGIVVLVNQNGSNLPSIIRNTVADKMLGLGYRNWNKFLKDAVAKNKVGEQQKQNADSINRKPNTKPSHQLKDYEGRFENPGYGIVTIVPNHDTLWVDYNNSKGKLYLSHYHYDIFRLKSLDDDNDDEGAAKVKFITNDKGDIGSFETSLEPAVKDIVFSRLSPTIKVDSSDLQPYVGNYELNKINIKVYLKGTNTLMVLVPGQPDYELVPTRKNEFDFKALKGFSVKFDISGDRATAINFIQPNGIFKAERKN
jgi:CubicO group peptidase (beta-lactamase class C family)